MPIVSRKSQQLTAHNAGEKQALIAYSLIHFMEHDLIHGVWHIDKGVLFTVKELILRPGDSVRGFIQGKRVGFFSFDPDYSLLSRM